MSLPRITSLDLLQPQFRKAVKAVLADLQAAGIPLKVFEAARCPGRQDELFARGGVTKARRWQSPHQWGLAVDMVFFDGKDWSWSEPAKHRGAWAKYHEIARKHGLAPLSWEAPHVQPVGFDWKPMVRGPDDFQLWTAWLAAFRGK